MAAVTICSLYVCVCVWICVRPWAYVLTHFSHVHLFATLWAIVHSAPLSVQFSGQNYWSGLPCPSGDLPHPGLEPTSLTSPASASGFFSTSATRKSFCRIYICSVVPRLCDPMDCSQPGSSVHGILQARILEWVAIPRIPRGLPNPEVIANRFFTIWATTEAVCIHTHTHTPHLYPFLCRWTFRLLPCLGYCKYCWSEHSRTRLFELVFLLCVIPSS